MTPEEFAVRLFPLTSQLSVSLIGNTDRGTLTAEARIGLVAKLVATQLAPAAPPARAGE